MKHSFYFTSFMKPVIFIIKILHRFRVLRMIYEAVSNGSFAV